MLRFGLRWWGFLTRCFAEKFGDHAPDIETGIEVPETRNPIRPSCVPIVFVQSHKVSDNGVR